MPIILNAAILYVGPSATGGGDGSDQNNMISFEMISKGNQSGNVFLLTAGFYGAVELQCYGTENSWATLRAYEEGVLFDSVRIINRVPSYLVLDGIKIASDSRNRNTCVNIVNGSSEIKLLNLEMQSANTDLIYLSPCGVNVGAGSSNIIIENCQVHDIIRGIEVYGNNVVVKNNKLYNISSSAIMTGGKDILVDGNLVVNQLRRPMVVNVSGVCNGTFIRSETVEQFENGVVVAFGVIRQVLDGGLHIYQQWGAFEDSVDKKIIGRTSGAELTNISSVEITDHDHGSGISVWSDDIVIRGNIINNFGNSYGIGFYNSDENPVKNVVVENNLICEPRGYQMFRINSMSTSSDSKIIVRNNTFVGRELEYRLPHQRYRGDICLYFQGRSEADNISTLYFYNNIVICSIGGFAVENTELMISGNLNEGNNIIWVVSGPNWRRLDYLSPESTSMVIVDKNDKIKSDYQGADSDCHIFSVPGQCFVDPGGHNYMTGYELTENSLAKDFGNINHATKYDIRGFARDLRPDAGCYEYGASVPYVGGEENIDPENITLKSKKFVVYNNVLKGQSPVPASIQCDFEQPVNVKIVIYDSKGKEVKNVFSGLHSGGLFIYAWNGDDNGGKKVGSGVYMVHMKAGNYTETKKIVVVR